MTVYFSAQPVRKVAALAVKIKAPPKQVQSVMYLNEHRKMVICLDVPIVFPELMISSAYIEGRSQQSKFLCKSRAQHQHGHENGFFLIGLLFRVFSVVSHD